MIYPGQKVLIENEIIVNGEINLHGYKDLRVNIETSNQGKIKVYGSLKSSYVQFTGANVITSNNATLEFERCLFYDIEGKFISDYQSTICMSFCDGGSVKSLGNFYESKGYFKGNVFDKGNVLMYSKGSLMNITGCIFKNYKKYISGDHISQTNIWSSEISNSDTLFQLANASTCNIMASSLSNFDSGFNSEKCFW